MNILVSWADESMSKSLGLCRQSALLHGIDMIASDVIDGEFINMNKDIFAQDRGKGYWLWKPYLIFQALINSEDDDLIVYSDAGIELIGSIQPLINAMDSSILLFSNGWPHIEWCKMDVVVGINALTGFQTVQTQGGNFYSMNGYEDRKQVQASNMLFRNSEASRDFVKEWLLFCQMPHFIDDSPSQMPNFPTFAEHRHDQAILTCLALKYGIKQHWFPSTTNLHKRQDFDDRYDPVFLHHRKRNNEW